MAEPTDGAPASGIETPNPIPYLRPDEKELDTIQVEAQLERDSELRNYESERLAANLRLVIAENMSNEALVAQAKEKIISIETNLTESVRVSKEKILGLVDTIFQNFGVARETGPEQSFSQRIASMSKVEMIYLAHVMNKNVDYTSINGILKTIIPLTITSDGVTVYLSLYNHSLFVEAGKLS